MISFTFQETKYKIHATVSRECSSTGGDGNLYITVTLRFEGITGRSVFAGTAIAVPQDWNYYKPGTTERNRITKKGVQLALNRAIYDFIDEQIARLDWKNKHHFDVDIRYKQIATAFWEEFLLYVEEL